MRYRGGAAGRSDVIGAHASGVFQLLL